MLDVIDELEPVLNGSCVGPALTPELLTGLRDGVAVLNQALRVTAWNSKLEKWTGLKAAEAIGRMPERIGLSFSGEEIIRLVRLGASEMISVNAVFQRPTSETQVHGSRASQSKRVELKLACYSWLTLQGDIGGYVLVASRRSQNRGELGALVDRQPSTSKASFNQKLADLVPEAAAVVSKKGRIKAWNGLAVALFGHTARDVVDKHLTLLVDLSRRQPDITCVDACDACQHAETGASNLDLKEGIQHLQGLCHNQKTFPLEIEISEIAWRQKSRFLVRLRHRTHSQSPSDPQPAGDPGWITTERLRQLAAHQESAREAERMRIARELHDETGGLLTVAKFDLDRLSKTPGVNLTLVEKVRGHVDAAINSTRSIIEDMRPPVVAHLRIWDAIDTYLSGSLICHALRYQLVVAADLETFEPGPELGMTLFRMVQETLSNVLKHANANKFVVQARRLGTTMVELDIYDDGCGLSEHDLAKPGHWGITGMHERIRSHGGTLVVKSVPGHGTRLQATFRID